MDPESKERQGHGGQRRRQIMATDSSEYEQSEEVRIVLNYWFYSRILSCLGLLFLFVTLITPNWIRVKSSLSKITLGLWSICIEDSCQLLLGNSPILNSCRFLMSMSTLCGLVAVSAALISDPRLSQSKWPLLANLSTGLISLVAILLYGLSVIDKIDFEKEEDVFLYSFSFSFVGGCIGCILFLMCGVLFAVIKIKESAIISPLTQSRQEEREESMIIRQPARDSIVMTDSVVACTRGVM